VEDNVKKAKEFFDKIDTSADGQLDAEELQVKYPQLTIDQV
jgi:hypothetical protein